MGVRHDHALAGPDHTGSVPATSGMNQNRRAAKLFSDVTKSGDGHVTLLRLRGHRQK